MIERKKAYKQFLLIKPTKALEEGSAASYISYLNNVTNNLGIDITSSTISGSEAVEAVVNRLRSTGIPSKSRNNCQSALNAYLEFLQHNPLNNIVYPDDVVAEFAEGAVIRVIVNKYERDPKARDACIAIHKPICKVCSMDFESTYGDIGKNFIHVHHVVPISSIGKGYRPDPEKDLIPVCPNCHAMLHKRTPPLTIKELREIIGKDL